MVNHRIGTKLPSMDSVRTHRTPPVAGLSLMSILALFSLNSFAQGTPTLSGNNSFTGTNTFPIVNNIIFVDGVKNTSLASALSSCPSAGCIVYTTIPEAWTSTVLNTAPQGTHIYFGAGKWTTTVTQTLPANVIVTGEAGRNAGQQGTSIQAVTGFPTTGAAVLELGSGGPAIEGTRVENMTVDCNGISDATGILDNQAQEKSGARDVLVTACPAIGVDVEAGGQGSAWENIEVFPSSWNNTCASCGAATLLLKVNSTGNVTFRNLTLNGYGPSTHPTTAAEINESTVDFDGGIHCEGVTTTCFDVSSGSLVEMNQVNCSRGVGITTLTNCIVIENGSQNSALISVSVDGYTTNIISDVKNGNTLTGSGEGYSVGLYVTGNGSTQPVLTSSVNKTFRVGALAVEGTKSAIAKLADGRSEMLYALESPENWFEDFGTARLENGTALVQINNDFLASVNTQLSYRVFLSANGPCGGLYVAKKNPTGFEVKELSHRHCNVDFDYRVVAKRRGFEKLRMEQAEGSLAQR